MQRHIIHKQKVVLYVAGEAGSHLLQETVSRLLHNGLAERMENILDNAVAADELIRIDKLVIDLNAISSSNFENDFKKAFVNEFEKKLASAIYKTRQENEQVSTPGRLSLADSLIYFLEHGVLPWYASVTDMRTWEQEIITTFSNQEWQAILLFLRQNYKTLPYSLNRFILQFSDSILEKTFFAISQLQNWDVFYKEVMGIKAGADSLRRLRHQFWLSAFKVLFGYRFTNILLIASSLANSQPLQDDGLLGHIQTIKAKYAGEDGSSLKPETNEPLADTPEAEKKPDKPEDVLYVQNSGVILLHPFLQLYFKELGLLATNYQFIDDTAQKRAVLLLNYLATSDAGAPEYELALQKILCGLTLDDALPAGIAITDQEKEESLNLLTAVTQHWQPLNNTSVEGLRVTFLQRDGKLSHIFSGWRLQIEPKTVDVLLGKLPWTYSTIKLPWMKELINIDWYQ